jgi:hypothetical protein
MIRFDCKRLTGVRGAKKDARWNTSAAALDAAAGRPPRLRPASMPGRAERLSPRPVPIADNINAPLAASCAEYEVSVMASDNISRRNALGGLIAAAGGSTLASPGQAEANPADRSLLASEDMLGSSDSDKGASLLNAKRTGPGTLVRSQRDRNERDQIPLLDFCSGSEAEDASRGFAAAVEKVLELNGDLLVPAGVYRLTDTARITFPPPDLFRSFNMRGMGNGSRILWDGGNDKPMLHLRGVEGMGWYTKCRFENLLFHGNSFSSDEFSGVTAIQLGDTPERQKSGICNPFFGGLTIQHVACGIHGFYESDEVTVFDCYIERFTDYGIFNQHGGGNWTLLSNHVSDGAELSTGIRSSLSSTRAIGNTIQGMEFAVGIQIDGGSANRGQSPYIVGNYIECQLDHVRAIALFGVQGGLIETNIFKGCRGSTLIMLEDSSDGMPCRNIQIGAHMHHVSAGFVDRFAHCSDKSLNCAITGHLESIQEDGNPGIFTTAAISGPFVETFQNGERAPRAINVGAGALKVSDSSRRAEFGVAPQPARDLGTASGAGDRRWNNVLTQRLSLIDGIAPPAPLEGHAQLFVDAADGVLKIRFADGRIRRVVTSD